MMTAQETDPVKNFKGIPGGDPSRRPPLINHAYRCLTCGSDQSVQTHNPRKYTPPKHCSTECKNAEITKKFFDIIAEKEFKNVPQVGTPKLDFMDMFTKRYNTYTALDADPSLVRSRQYIVNVSRCAQCFNVFNRIHIVGDGDPAKYCSSKCIRSSRAKLPVGTVCRSPHKMYTMNTRDQMEAELLHINASLAASGDTEGLVPYLCDCNKWHAGHLSNAHWEIFNETLINDLESALNTLVIKHMSKKNKSRWLTQRAKVLKNS